MLNILQISDLMKYKDSMHECIEKELLGTLISEYLEYARCGTPEECASRKEWMSYSIEDILVNYKQFLKGMREEVDLIRSDYESRLRSKKKSKPIKESD